MGSSASRVGIICVLLVALVAWTHARPIAHYGDAPEFMTLIPLAFDGWIGRDAPPLDPDVARVLAADQYVHRYYAKRSVPPGLNSGSTYDKSRPSYERQPIEADLAYYARPQAGAAMHSPLNCLPGNGWQIIETRPLTVTAASRAWNVRRLVVDRNGHRIAMAYWFQNRGAVLGNEYEQRLRLLTNGLRGRPTDAALVRVMARDTEPGRRAMEAFTRDLIVRLNGAFR
jgi:EpsI family protein